MFVEKKSLSTLKTENLCVFFYPADDFPPLPQFLPRALSPADDQRLQEEFQRSDDPCTQALLLTRAAGLRIGECIDLSVDCLRAVDGACWCPGPFPRRVGTPRTVRAECRAGFRFPALECQRLP
jgi:integrase